MDEIVLPASSKYDPLSKNYKPVPISHRPRQAKISWNQIEIKTFYDSAKNTKSDSKCKVEWDCLYQNKTKRGCVSRKVHIPERGKRTMNRTVIKRYVPMQSESQIIKNAYKLYKSQLRDYRTDYERVLPPISLPSSYLSQTITRELKGNGKRLNTASIRNVVRLITNDAAAYSHPNLNCVVEKKIYHAPGRTLLYKCRGAGISFVVKFGRVDGNDDYYGYGTEGVSREIMMNQFFSQFDLTLPLVFRGVVFANGLFILAQVYGEPSPAVFNPPMQQSLFEKYITMLALGVVCYDQKPANLLIRNSKPFMIDLGGDYCTKNNISGAKLGKQLSEDEKRHCFVTKLGALCTIFVQGAYSKGRFVDKGGLMYKFVKSIYHVPLEAPSRAEIVLRRRYCVEFLLQMEHTTQMIYLFYSWLQSKHSCVLGKDKYGMANGLRRFYRNPTMPSLMRLFAMWLKVMHQHISKDITFMDMYPCTVWPVIANYTNIPTGNGFKTCITAKTFEEIVVSVKLEHAIKQKTLT